MTSRLVAMVTFVVLEVDLCPGTQQDLHDLRVAHERRLVQAGHAGEDRDDRSKVNHQGKH